MLSSKLDQKPASTVLSDDTQLAVTTPAAVVVTRAINRVVLDKTSWFFKRRLGPDVEKLIVKFITDPVETKKNIDHTNLKGAAAFVSAAKSISLTCLLKENLRVEHEKRVTELCQNVAYGNYNNVKAILEKNPMLLLHKARVSDYSFYEDEKGTRIYREHEGTAYQLALAFVDVSRIQFADEGMAEMIEGYFPRACGSEVKAAAEIRRQQQEQFPAGWEKDDAEKKAKNLKALTTVVKALEDAELKFIYNDDELNGINHNRSRGETVRDAKFEAALKEFREFFRPSAVITSGKDCTLDLLQKAYELHDEKFDDFGRGGGGSSPWSTPKNIVFWRKIIGYILRYLPANYAQAVCQSIYANSSQRLTRTLIIGKTSLAFFPLDQDPPPYLGFGWAVRSIHPYGADAAGGNSGQDRERLSMAGCIRDIHQHKTAVLHRLLGNEDVPVVFWSLISYENYWLFAENKILRDKTTSKDLNAIVSVEPYTGKSAVWLLAYYRATCLTTPLATDETLRNKITAKGLNSVALDGTSAVWLLANYRVLGNTLLATIEILQNKITVAGFNTVALEGESKGRSAISYILDPLMNNLNGIKFIAKNKILRDKISVEGLNAIEPSGESAVLFLCGLRQGLALLEEDKILRNKITAQALNSVVQSGRLKGLAAASCLMMGGMMGKNLLFADDKRLFRMISSDCLNQAIITHHFDVSPKLKGKSLALALQDSWFDRRLLKYHSALQQENIVKSDDKKLDAKSSNPNQLFSVADSKASVNSQSRQLHLASVDDLDAKSSPRAPSACAIM